MLSVMNLDEGTASSVVDLADSNLRVSRNRVTEFDLGRLCEFKVGDLSLNDRLVLAQGFAFDPNKGEIVLLQYDGSLGKNVVTATVNGIFAGNVTYNQQKIELLSVTLEDGSQRYIGEHERLVRYSDMFSENGEYLPDFVAGVKKRYEADLQTKIKWEQERIVKLRGIEADRHATVEDNQLEHLALDYRDEEALTSKLKEISYSVTIPIAPDFEKDLGLEPVDGPSLWDTVLPLGVDPFTGLTTFFHVENTNYDKGNLVGVVVKLCHIDTRRTRTENVMVYEIEEGEEVVLKPEMLRKQLVATKFRYRELRNNIGFISSERARELLRGAIGVYVDALCARLGRND